MKSSRILFYAISIVAFKFLVSCSNQHSKESQVIEYKNSAKEEGENFAELTFIDDFYDFGSIKYGEVVSYTFRLKNTGNIPLVIKDIVTECGCTKSKLSKNVLNPDEEANVEVIFDSSGWRGMHYKSVTLRSNGKIKDKSVTIKANIVL